jgi:transcriptional regulator with XRE-family HTH domain
MSQKARVAARIREIRKQRSLTQEALAERIDRSVDAISGLERGLALPSFETLEKLAQALDVPLRDFFDTDERESPERAGMIAALLLHARGLSDADLAVAVAQIAILTKPGRAK